MKTGELAAILGVDPDTIKNWIKRPELTKYFSSGARGEHGSVHRVYTESDVLALNTIRHLRSQNVSEWDEIASFLETGEREQEFPQNAIAADPRTIPIRQAEQSAKAMATLAERDAALQRVAELEEKLSQLERDKEEIREKLTIELNETREKLLREIAALNREVGRAYHEGYLDALKSQAQLDD